MNLDSSLEMIRALHQPSRNPSTDEWVRLCEDAAQLALKTPEQQAVRSELFEITIQRLVIDHEGEVIKADIEALTPEQREVFDSLAAMDDEQLRDLANGIPERREEIARMLWYRGEEQRYSHQLNRLSGELRDDQ